MYSFSFCLLSVYVSVSQVRLAWRGGLAWMVFPASRGPRESEGSPALLVWTESRDNAGTTDGPVRARGRGKHRGNIAENVWNEDNGNTFIFVNKEHCKVKQFKKIVPKCSCTSIDIMW